MRVRRFRNLVTMYVLSLGATMTLLVVWVVYVVRSAARLSDLGQRVGLNWLLLSVGCLLLFFLIVGLTYQLAQALAARRYVLKQDEFVANITHEMKSPLAAIKLHAQTLQQADVGFDKSRRFLATIEQQADRAAALVDAVLESSRLQARKQRLDLVPVALAPFWEAYFEAARPRVEGRGVALRAQATGAGSVLGSEEALRRILDNLIDNAVRFSKPGGEVRCRLSTAPGVARIAVEDDGVGIPEGELASIFDRFYQARRQSEPHRQGSGLGLSIVAGLVGEMRGSVRAHSQEGRPGTLFVIELPLAAPAGAAR